MNEWDYWRLRTELTVWEAACLIIGAIPGEYEAQTRVGNDLSDSDDARYHTNLGAATGALEDAIRQKQLPAVVCEHGDEEDLETRKPEYLIRSNHIRDWLKTKVYAMVFLLPRRTNPHRTLTRIIQAMPPS